MDVLVEQTDPKTGRKVFRYIDKKGKPGRLVSKRQHLLDLKGQGKLAGLNISEINFSSKRKRSVSCDVIMEFSSDLMISLNPDKTLEGARDLQQVDDDTGVGVVLQGHSSELGMEWAGAADKNMFDNKSSVNFNDEKGGDIDGIAAMLPNPASLVDKPPGGGMNPDHIFTSDAINYAVRYIGCMEVNTSMKVLDFETRSAIVKECINRVCEAGGKAQNEFGRRRGDRKIQSMLGDTVTLSRAGTNVQLTITSLCLCLSDLDSGRVIHQHEMPNISFASGGDADTLDYIAYVANDGGGGRACYVLECGGGLAQDVITTVGQAFELRFKVFLKKSGGNQAVNGSVVDGDGIDEVSEVGSSAGISASIYSISDVGVGTNDTSDHDEEDNNELTVKTQNEIVKKEAAIASLKVSETISDLSEVCIYLDKLRTEENCCSYVIEPEVKENILRSLTEEDTSSSCDFFEILSSSQCIREFFLNEIVQEAINFGTQKTILKSFPPDLQSNFCQRLINEMSSTAPRLLCLIIKFCCKPNEPITEKQVRKVVQLSSQLTSCINQKNSSLQKLISLKLKLSSITNSGLDFLHDVGITQSSRSLQRDNEYLASISKDSIIEELRDKSFSYLVDNLDKVVNGTLVNFTSVSHC